MVRSVCMLSVHLFKGVLVVYISSRFPRWSWIWWIVSVGVALLCSGRRSYRELTAGLEQSNASVPASFPAILFPYSITLSAFANVFQDGEIWKCYSLFKINEHLTIRLKACVLNFQIGLSLGSALMPVFSNRGIVWAVWHSWAIRFSAQLPSNCLFTVSLREVCGQGDRMEASSSWAVWVALEVSCAECHLLVALHLWPSVCSSGAKRPRGALFAGH